MDWSKVENEVVDRLSGPLHPAADFGWAVQALRAAMVEIERLRVTKPRRERKT